MSDQETIKLVRDGDAWFAWLSGRREETETDGRTKMEALESLKWTLEDLEW